MSDEAAATSAPAPAAAPSTTGGQSSSGGSAAPAQRASVGQFFADRAEQAATRLPDPGDDAALADAGDIESGDGVESVDAATVDETDAADLLHGLKRDEILKAIEEGRLPDELLGVLKRTVRYGDDEIEETLHDSLRAGLREADYTRKLAGVHAKMRELDDEIADQRGLFDAWRAAGDGGSTKALRDGLHELELWPAFYALAREWAVEAAHERRLRTENPEAYIEYRERKMEREAREREEAKRAREERRGKRAQEREGAVPNTARARAMASKIEKALTSRNLPHENPKVQEHFSQAMQVYRRENPNASADELIEQAASSTADYIADLARAYERSKAPKPPAPATGPGKGGAAAPAPKRQAERNQPSTIADFMARRRGY